MKLKGKILFLVPFLFLLLVSTSKVNATISYNEAFEKIDESGWINGAWNLDEDVGNAPIDSVAEIIATWDSTNSNGWVGVRNTTSSLSRMIELNEAENGGNTTARFLVQVDGSGNADFYGGANADYYLIGYWEGVTFNEKWVTYQVNSGEGGFAVWHETDGIELDLVADKTHLIMICNDDAGKEYWGGVRNSTSTLPTRASQIMEAEGGGNQTFSLFVQSDINKKIEVMAEMWNDIWLINEGNFVEPTLRFNETHLQYIASGVSDVWQECHNPLLPSPPKIFDIRLDHSNTDADYYIGVRNTTSTLDRKIRKGESEGGGRSVFSMTVNSDANGNFSLYEDNKFFCIEYFEGYFDIIEIGNVTLLFGAGFNESVPYINLRWNYSGEVDVFEISHSIDGSAFTILDYTANQFYTHTGLVNGSYHWYRVRSTYFKGSWCNSSFSPLNLERVYYVLGGGAVNITRIGVDGVWREYNVSSITVIHGVYDVGQLNSTIFVDGNVYRVNETVGADCLDLRMNFTGIPEDALSLRSLCYCEYEGNPAHIVMCQAWNFDSSEWVDLHLMQEHGFRWMNDSLSLGGFIEDGTGNVWYRYNHISNGASGHYLTVDYLKLRAFIPVGEIVDAWSINWLIGLIWIALVAIGYFKENKILIMFSGFLGLIFGLLIMGESAMASIALILFSLYLLYEGT